MRHVFVCVVAFSCWTCCFGQGSTTYKACGDAVTSQSELTRCADAEARRVELELNEIYKKLIAKALTNPVALNKIRAAETAWMKYRDAYINAMYPARDKQKSYGTIFPMEVLDLRTRLTREHIVALNEMLDYYDQLQ